MRSILGGGLYVRRGAREKIYSVANLKDGKIGDTLQENFISAPLSQPARKKKFFLAVSGVGGR